MHTPMGKSTAPKMADPVVTLTDTAKAADSAKIAPAMKERIRVSRVDMRILASPASTILVTNSLGLR